MSKVDINYSERFLSERKKYVRDRQKFKTLAKVLRFFVADPFHPSLRIEKLRGSAVWTIRVTKGDRIFFRWKDKKTALFLDIGPHDKYRKY